MLQTYSDYLKKLIYICEKTKVDPCNISQVLISYSINMVSNYKWFKQKCKKKEAKHGNVRVVGKK